MRKIGRYFQPQLISIFFLGFSSGLPLALTSSTFQIWQADLKIDLTTIGLFTLVGVPYSLKFLWSPLIDRSFPPGIFKRLGRRRGWALLTQMPLAFFILLMGFQDPRGMPEFTALLAVLVAFFSASQDIVIDGYRIESLTKDQQGLGSAMVIYGYRLSSQLIAGWGALYLAEIFGWAVAYICMAAAMLVGILTILFSPEPQEAQKISHNLGKTHGAGWGVVFIAAGGVIAVVVYLLASKQILSSLIGETKIAGAVTTFISTFLAALTPFVLLRFLPEARSSRGPYRHFQNWLQGAIYQPFADIQAREGWKAILAFIILYKLGDAVLGVNASAFYVKIGFDKIQIADVTKIWGLAATLAGTFLGGAFMAWRGVGPALLWAGILQALSNLSFAWLASVGPDIDYFKLTIVVENVTGGMGAVVLVGYLSALCNISFTATQYALFSSLAALGRTVLAAPFSGLADTLGWVNYYFLSMAMALPGLIMLVWMIRRYPESMGIAANKQADAVASTVK